MCPFTDRLRSRIVGAVGRGEGPWRVIARQFVVILSSVVRLVLRHRRDGAIRPRPHAGGQHLDSPEPQHVPDSWLKFTETFRSETRSIPVADVDGRTRTVRRVSIEGQELDRFTLTG